ncbi:hypothetical protein PLICRDRAFT_167839 [Plicaturopsis crispa FD-325 SS-3]|uniref:C3H1-type domain-containing protein n=1 Tax=Plicaturopsis crispa FD-325 SS-3 TaxID=944288 RepID=A0A0C9T831_PLICR|nr:hypothetical protein PLICRDRAFT_167839 [Plicaturopsis crispa FD-325 SS-3]
MPVADRSEDLHESEKDRDVDGGGDREKGKGKGSSKTAKDLSHVPCKFFKVGSCTAGASCPFSHSATDPGHQKDVCAWFVKGNCKFGHKCALAHVLPGQSMAMDRKNKKAAQLAAGAGGGQKGGRNQRRDAQNGSSTSGGGPGLNGRSNSLLSGSTAPTRSAGSRPPMNMPLKATISPSAPAPPLKDTDFASFDLLDDTNKLSAAPAQSKASPELSASDPAVESSKPANAADAKDSKDVSKPSPPQHLPVSTPSAPRRLGLGQHRSSSNSIDFGPIGSPPRSSPSAGQTRINGFSPGTSPAHGAVGFTSTSPFSAPGTQTAFLSYNEKTDSSDFKAHSGLAASLGTTRTWNTNLGPVPSQVTNRADANKSGAKGLGNEFAVEEDLEEFLPSSLTDLLTPEERSHRMSRTNQGQHVGSPGMLGAQENLAGGQNQNADRFHQFSRSVPAPSLLGDVRSIWADNGSGLPGSPGAHGAGGLGSGTPASYKSGAGFGGRSFGEDGPSPSLLSPSNASAAFLPGLHHHYLNSKSGIQRSSSNLRAGGAFHPSGLSGTTTPNHNPNQYQPSGGHNDAAFSPPRMNAFGNRPPFESNPSDPYHQPYTHNNNSNRSVSGGNGGFGNEGEDRRTALSPSALALQAHAPGQSLPQGLAAGYSRIHAQPLPPSIPSPSAAGVLSSSHIALSPYPVNGHDWSSNVGGQGDHASFTQGGGNAQGSPSGLDSMFSRLSYSAAASRGPPGLPPLGAPAQVQSQPVVSPPGIVRNTSGRNWQSQGPLSPLSGPVVTGDDDDLFSMDG